MSNVRYSNIFASPFGWGPLSGTPTIYVEFFGCNLTCSKLNNPTGELIFVDTKDGNYDRNEFKRGCNARFSWHKDYLHSSKLGNTDSISDSILKLLGRGGFKSRRPLNLCFTGGEPMLHQGAIVEILQKLDRKCGLDGGRHAFNVLIETNATVHMQVPFMEYLAKWKRTTLEDHYSSREVYMLCSPKLSNTGEDTLDTIKPSVISDILKWKFELCFNFAARHLNEDFDEIEAYIQTCVNHIKSEELAIELHENDSTSLRKLLSSPTYVYPVEVPSALEQKFQHKVMQRGLSYNKPVSTKETVDCLS